MRRSGCDAARRLGGPPAPDLPGRRRPGAADDRIAPAPAAAVVVPDRLQRGRGSRCFRRGDLAVDPGPGSGQGCLHNHRRHHRHRRVLGVPQRRRRGGRVAGGRAGVGHVASRGPSRRRVLRPVAAVGRGRRDDGLGQRPDRAVPGPGGAVDCRLRAGGAGSAPGHFAGGRAEVLRAGGVRLGLLPVRRGAPVRRHRLHEVGAHRRLPGRRRPGVQRPAPRRHGAAARGSVLQGGRGAVPRLDARRLRGIAPRGGGPTWQPA